MSKKAGYTPVKVLLSLWVILHFSAITVAPNRISYWVTPAEKGRVPYYDDKPAWIDAYLGPLGLLSSWSYFAPEPGPPPLFLDWEAENSKGDVIRSGSFPDKDFSSFWSERRNRMVASAYFMIAVDERVQKMLVPFLCHQLLNTSVERIRLYRRAHKIPLLPDVLEGKVTEFNAEDFERQWVSTTFCPIKEAPA